MAGGPGVAEPTGTKRVMPPHAPASASAPRHGFRLWERGLPALGVVVGLLLVAGPFLATLIRSLLYWAPDGGASVSLRNFTALIGDARFQDAALNTLICGAGATAVSCTLGVTLAWIVSRTDVPGRSWFEVGNLIPFFLSPYVGAEAWSYLGSPNSGILQKFLYDTFGVTAAFLNIFSLAGVIWVLAIFYTPYVYLLVISPLRRKSSIAYSSYTPRFLTNTSSSWPGFRAQAERCGEPLRRECESLRASSGAPGRGPQE